jgi:membrane-associated phospholipid phosphatase
MPVGAGDVTAIEPRGNLLDARPGGVAERLGDRFRRLSPLATALIVAVVGWVALVALMIGLGVLLVEVLLPGALGSWDGSVVRTFVDERTELLTDASWLGSGLAETVTVVTAGVVLSVVLLAKRAWPLLGLVVLSLVVEITVYMAVTNVVHRQRPIVEQLEQRRQGASFPSGHTAAAVVLYFLIAAVVSVYVARPSVHRVVWGAVVLIPVIVAVSRIYRGMHNPTDAIAGLVMGIGSVVVALLAIRTAGVVADRGRRTGAVERSNS